MALPARTAAVIVALVAVAVFLSFTTLPTASAGEGGHTAKLSQDTQLDENETATLWSKEPNECLSVGEYEERFGTTPTAMQELASCTDITFNEPPDTAARWTSAEFPHLEAGDTDTSVYPSHAERVDSVAIADAHATIFAILPSTKAHLDPTDSVYYVAPTGEVRGFVDYRVRLENSRQPLHENQTVERSLTSTSIQEVRLKRDGDVHVRADGTHTPLLEYDFERGGPATLTLEADIETALEEVTTTIGNDSEQTETRTIEETVTVTHDIDVVVYDLRASVYQARYPDGDAGVAIYTSQPWHGYTLTSDGEVNVSGIWRYYTARDTDWDELTQGTRHGEEVFNSSVRPVFVHAYPSAIGPRVEPIRDGPDILEVWGRERDSPEPAIHENVEIDVVSGTYTDSSGLALRYDTIDRDEIAVAGIVRGVHAELIEPDGSTEREIRESELTIERLESNATSATFLIELRDVETGSPITLENWADDPRLSVIGQDSRSGYITVGNEIVRTDLSGRVEVTVTQPGIYTATYHPGSWRSHQPAYIGDTATETWHPLGTATGWFVLLVDVIRYALPFAVALYAAQRVGTFLKIKDTP
ncbi:hypothetical protein ACLI4U_13675 [Natrialbaceae archaeon A-CW2]